MAIITYPLNNVTYQAADAELYNSTRTSGVWGLGNNLAVSAISGMSITIAGGLAWIKNADFTGKCIGVTAPVTLTLAAADNTQPRIDRIVLRFTTSDNATQMMVKTGTPAASPVPVAREATATVYELVLYDVLIPAASASIATGNITDQRANADLCGIMRNSVEGAVPDTRKINGKPLTADITLAAVDVGVSPDDFVQRSGGTMSADPTAVLGVATKRYVDKFALRECARFTASGTFNPASYPSKNNLYLVVAVGGGQDHSLNGNVNGRSGMLSSGFTVITSAQTAVVGATGSNGGASYLGEITASGGTTAADFAQYGAFGNGSAGTSGAFAAYGKGGTSGVSGTSGIVVVYNLPV